MAKTASYTCTACGASFTKWSGRCDGCGDWNTIIEEAPLASGPAAKSLGAKRGRGIQLTDLASEEVPPPRTHSGLSELDRVLGPAHRCACGPSGCGLARPPCNWPQKPTCAIF
jgi:DNA repair protein RadA/Sms